uniref:Uncharacterized protein n=1 Tax=Anguilla anguilla TaxID=7936 RepID=A0A0E9WL72_ANGAN
MAIPPSIPVVQNLAHLVFPPSKMEIWLMLFLCRDSSTASLVSEVAFLSMFWKRSLAVIPRWALCLGTSSFPLKVMVPFASS